MVTPHFLTSSYPAVQYQLCINIPQLREAVHKASKIGRKFSTKCQTTNRSQRQHGSPIRAKDRFQLPCSSQQSVPRTYKGSVWGAEGCAIRAPILIKVLPVIGSTLRTDEPSMNRVSILQDAHGVEISMQASTALFGHSITIHTSMEPFHYPSRIHAWHEHHE